MEIYLGLVSFGRHSLQRRSLKLTFLVSCFLKYTHYNFNRIFAYAKNVIAVASHAGILNVANSEPRCDKLLKTTRKSKVEKPATERRVAIHLIKSTIPFTKEVNVCVPEGNFSQHPTPARKW